MPPRLLAAAPSLSSSSSPAAPPARRGPRPPRFAASASSPVRVCTDRRFSSGRPIHFWRGGRTTICDFARLAGRDLERRRFEADLQLVVGILVVERDGGRRVGRVLDRDLVARLAAAGGALGLELGLELLERLDAEVQRGGRGLRVVGLRLGGDLELPDPRLGLGGAGRVEVDLHLLLVRPAGAERRPGRPCSGRSTTSRPAVRALTARSCRRCRSGCARAPGRGRGRPARRPSRASRRGAPARPPAAAA